MIRIFFLLAVLSPGVAHAARFTMEEAVAHALRHNPEVAAARHRIAEAEGRLLHSGRLPDPELEVEVMPNLEGREFAAGIGLTRKFPLNKRLQFEKKAVQADVDVARLEIRELEVALAAQVRTLAVKLLDLEARRDLQHRRTAHRKELAAATARAAAAGEGSALAAAEMELETAEVEARLLQLASEEAALQGALRPLLGVPVTEPVTVTGRLAEPAPPSAPTEGKDLRARYQAAQARLAAAQKNLELQRASRWEDISVGVGYEREHAEDAGYGMRRENFLGLKVSVPLPLGVNNLSHVREAEATTRRREAEVVAVAQALEAEAAAAHSEMAAAASLYQQASGSLLDKSRRLEERYLAAYQSGQAPLTDVLRAGEKRLALEAAALEARRDFNLAKVRLESVHGRQSSGSNP